MRKSVKALTLLAALLLVSVTWASDSTVPTDSPVINSHEIPRGTVKFAAKHPTFLNGYTPMPVPTEPESAGMRSVSIKGPVAMSSASIGTSLGSALVGSRGGAISSPRQQADREIRKVIRRLD